MIYTDDEMYFISEINHNFPNNKQRLFSLCVQAIEEGSPVKQAYICGLNDYILNHDLDIRIPPATRVVLPQVHMSELVSKFPDSAKAIPEFLKYNLVITKLGN